MQQSEPEQCWMASHHQWHPNTNSIPPPSPEGRGSSAPTLPLQHVPLFALSSALSINFSLIYEDVLFIFFSLLCQAGMEGPHLFIVQ